MQKIQHVTTVNIRPLLEIHWPMVKAIYESGIASGNATFQTEAPANWEQWDTGHVHHSRFVAMVENVVVGWVALSPTSGRDCYKGVCELSIYVDTDHRGKGIGDILMGAVIESSEANNTWCLYSSTFPENTASIHLQKKFGFREIGYRQKIAQLKGVWRDTLLFERRSEVAGI